MNPNPQPEQQPEQPVIIEDYRGPLAEPPASRPDDINLTAPDHKAMPAGEGAPQTSARPRDNVTIAAYSGLLCAMGGALLGVANYTNAVFKAIGRGDNQLLQLLWFAIPILIAGLLMSSWSLYHVRRSRNPGEVISLSLSAIVLAIASLTISIRLSLGRRHNAGITCNNVVVL